jgi:hypothetical protein
MQFRFTTHCSPGFTVVAKLMLLASLLYLGENGPERTFNFPYLPYLVMYPLLTAGESTSTAEEGSALQVLGVPLTARSSPTTPLGEANWQFIS